MGMLSQSRVQGIHSRRFCRCLSVLELLYGEPDLDIGGKMVVEAVHIPMPAKGMYVWGHKVTCSSRMHTIHL